MVPNQPFPVGMGRTAERPDRTFRELDCGRFIGEVPHGDHLDSVASTVVDDGLVDEVGGVNGLWVVQNREFPSGSKERVPQLQDRLVRLSIRLRPVEHRGPEGLDCSWVRGLDRPFERSELLCTATTHGL